MLENLEIERLGYIRNALSKYSELSMTAVPVVQTVSVLLFNAQFVTIFGHKYT